MHCRRATGPGGVSSSLACFSSTRVCASVGQIQLELWNYTASAVPNCRLVGVWDEGRVLLLLGFLCSVDIVVVIILSIIIYYSFCLSLVKSFLIWGSQPISNPKK